MIHICPASGWASEESPRLQPALHPNQQSRAEFAMPGDRGISILITDRKKMDQRCNVPRMSLVYIPDLKPGDSQWEAADAPSPNA